MAGWKTNDMLAGLPGILNLAAAGGTDLAIASDIVTDGLTGLGLTANDSSKFVDIMAATITNANTNVEMMGETLKYAGPVAGSLGITMEDLSLAIGLMGNAGIKASQAGTALRGGLTNLVKPTDNMMAAMEKYGISIQKTDDGSVDLMATIKLLREKLGGLEETTQANVLATIFGKEAMSGWASIVNATESDFDKLSTAIENSNGKSNELAEIMQENLGGSIDNMKSALEGALKDGFEAMLPVLEKVVQWITDAANWFSSLDEEAQKNIVTIAGVAAAAGPLLMALGQVLIVGGNAVTLFGALKVGGSNNIKMLGLLKGAISLVSGPAGLVALVGMLIAVTAKLGDNEDKLSDLQEKWGVFGQAIGMICETMTGTVQLSIGNIIILISTLSKTIMALLKGDFKSIDDIWAEGWAKIENNTAKSMSNIRNESTNGIALMREMTEIELNNVVGTFDVALKKLPELTADNAGEMADIFVTRMQGLDTKTLTILRGTSDTMAVLFDGIYENMSKEDAQKKFIANLESMAKSGEFTSDKISQDIADAMNLIDKNVMDGSERVKQSAQNMFDGISSISQFGMDSAVNNIVSSINNMSDETIKSLSAMGGHWEAIFGGIALTGKDAVLDMEGHIKGRLQELSQTSPQFIAEMKEQMDTYFGQINESGTTNTNELSNNVENALTNVENSMNTHTKNATNNVDINTKDAANKAKTNMDNAAKSVAHATSNMAKEAKKGTGDVAKSTDSDMQKANKAVQQSATDMYNGSKKSYAKMADVAKEEGTRMYKGVTTSAQKMSNNARSSATEMYKGVTTSTRKMADAAIADWNRIKSAYSKPISGKITKTTVNKSISTQGNEIRSLNNENVNTIDRIKNVSGVNAPDVRNFIISSKHYNSDNNSSNPIVHKSNNNIQRDTRSIDIDYNKITQAFIFAIKQTGMDNPTFIINGKEIARATAREIENEINLINTRKLRFRGEQSGM